MKPTVRPLPSAVDRLIAECRWETFRGSGPGGQKRNKTSSAVRITHEPSGLSAVASESRSQHENRRRALQRLRHRMALEIRTPIELEHFTPPAWFAQLKAPGNALRLSPRSGRYLEVVGLVLDVLTAAEGSVSAAAMPLGLGSANLVDFLQRDVKLLARANQIRSSLGLRKLGSA